MAAPGFGIGRSDGPITPLSAPPVPVSSPAQRQGEQLNPMSVAMEHMIVMMGRLEASMNEVVKAVKPEPPPIRPDPAPPFGRPDSTIVNQSGPSYIPGIPTQQPPQQLGFSGPPHQRRLADPAGLQYVSAPLPANTSLPEIFVPPTSQQVAYPANAAGNPNSTHNSLWSPPVTGQYGPTSWDLPNQRQPPALFTHAQQPQGPSCWDNPAQRHNSG